MGELILFSFISLIVLCVRVAIATLFFLPNIYYRAFYYSQFRTWADEFDNSTIEQKKMIACQLIREVKVSRGYELEIVFDLNYEQFLSL